MINLQSKIVASARGFVDTRFHHQGRLKRSENSGGGIDCLGLLIGVAAELDLPFAGQDEIFYSHYPDTQRLREKLGAVLREVSLDNMESGDILLLEIDGRAQHLAIVGEAAGLKTMIHAYAPARAVVEHILDTWWQARVVAVFRV